MEPVANQAVVRAYLDRGRDATLARGRFDAIFAAYLEHARAMDILPGEMAQSMMRQALAAVTLYLALHPPDEFTAWTLNIKEPPLNFFLAGDNNEFVVTGRVFTQDVRTSTSSRLFVETQRPRREPSQSVLDVNGIDVLDIFEQYHNRSEQIPSRLLEVAEHDFVFIQGLPRVDKKWLGSLDGASAKAQFERDLELIEERVYRFRCGCDPLKILTVVQKMYAGKADELFRGESNVEILCPRCGRRWWITREDFDLVPGRVGLT